MTNALFNDNRLKLGVFGLNVSNGCAATTAEGHLQPPWQNNLDIVVMADGHWSSCSPPLSSRCLRCLISLLQGGITMAGCQPPLRPRHPLPALAVHGQASSPYTS